MTARELLIDLVGAVVMVIGLWCFLAILFALGTQS
jgi:hypothetical protein